MRRGQTGTVPPLAGRLMGPKLSGFIDIPLELRASGLGSPPRPNSKIGLAERTPFNLGTKDRIGVGLQANEGYIFTLGFQPHRLCRCIFPNIEKTDSFSRLDIDDAIGCRRFVLMHIKQFTSPQNARFLPPSWVA